MEKLIKAVGEILTEKGHSALGLNKVALRAGVSKELIYRYFSGWNNLLKAYINSRDYWEPLLKDLAKEPVTGTEVLSLFTEMLQNQFQFFQRDLEMQSLILWQISEHNTLLRGISEERERDGASLLALAQDHFKESGISFNAVVALLLGGIYYVVLHAQHNKSTVAGIDVNLEKDRQLILKTVEQILTWAWNAAEQPV